MKLFKILYLISFFSLFSCGFDDNLPCRGSDCDDAPEQLPNTEDEG